MDEQSVALDVEKTTEAENQPSYEYNSFSSSLAYSNYYFGLNIFDMYSQDQLAALVKDPMANNQILRELSLILYGTNGQFSNSVDFMVAMPTLDSVVISRGASPTKKRRNEQLMESALRTIKHKEFLRDALFRDLVEGVCFYYLETVSRPESKKKMLTDYDVNSIVELNEVGMNASVISLPADYTRIVGFKNSSPVLAFNLDYFKTSDLEPIEQKLRKFPKEIRDAYNKKKGTWKESGNWVVLNNDHTISHKIKSKREEIWGRPLVLSAISDILYGDYFVQTKRNVLDDLNSEIYFLTFPESATKGLSALNKNQQESLHNSVKQAIQSKATSGKPRKNFFSLPAGTKLDSLDSANTDILDDKYESKIGSKISGNLGMSASLLDGESSGSFSANQQNLELVSARIFRYIDEISNELNKALNNCIIKDKKNQAEIKYIPITHVNKNSMISAVKDLYISGKGSISLWAAAVGIQPDIFFSLIEKEREMKWDEIPVHATSYNSSGNQDNNGGRPTTDTPTDSTVKSRNSDGNNTPSPSDN